MGILVLFVAQRIDIERDVAIGPMYSGESLGAQAANLDRMTRSERAGHRAEMLKSKRALRVAIIVGLALLIFGAIGWYSSIA
jgi:environmental stress-induced protein Ves